MNFAIPRIENISLDFAIENNISTDVLRLDKIHHIVSGNKWYKLKYYLQKAEKEHVKTIATFGGAYSNHIAATAYAAHIKGFDSFGVIRGGRAQQLSHTLQNAEQYGMKLYFVSREDYNNKDSIMNKFKDYFWIDEGGFGIDGAKGAADIYTNIPHNDYSHIIVAVGTGTTFAGLIKKSKEHQKILGISVMKNNFSLIDNIRSLLTPEEQIKNFELLHDFHFGGYARKTDELITYMNHIYKTTNLPLDFVYTAKAFYGMQDLTEKKSIPSGSSVLFIHSGGLQGNLSLRKGLLKF